MSDFKRFNGVIRLRRDNDFNYKKIEDTFIPADGEICLVDTAMDGLRAKCGDGVTVWKDLDYTDAELREDILSVVYKGYYYNGKFYDDKEHSIEHDGSKNELLIDLDNNTAYVNNGKKYEPLKFIISDATPDVAGISKLYNSLGNNTDGAINQKIVSEVIGKKVEASVSDDTLIFTKGI